MQRVTRECVAKASDAICAKVTVKQEKQRETDQVTSQVVLTKETESLNH